MKRQQWEVADLIPVAGHDFIEQNRHWLTAQHLKVLRAIERCRTIARFQRLADSSRPLGAVRS